MRFVHYKVELKNTFKVDRPKIIFCQSEKAPSIQLALNELELDSQIVTFDKGDYLCNFQEFLQKYGGDTDVDSFRAEDFDAEESIALLIATSGTTGMPKAAAVTHKNMAITGPHMWSRFSTFPTPTKMVYVGSPLQWLTAIINFVISPIFRYTRLQTSAPQTPEHTYYLFNKYKPTFTLLSPTTMTSLLKPGEREKCDFSCLELLSLAGSAVPPDLVDEIKKVTPNNPPPGACGKPIGCFQYRLINVETNEDIREPNVPGELWMKGPGIIKEYYNNPEATAETFAEDGWFKTGDIYQISPVEIESVIRQHPDVLDVAVTGIPDPECGELPVACVVRKPGCKISAQEVKDLVKDNLADSKQLRGGVIFLTEIPVTASTKVHRRKIKEMAMVMPRE
ncbi:hypothetical protein ACJJTC_001517 [Scirpophaga incertulas]